MLTGDVASVAHAVARRLGLSSEEVHAEALPDEKAELVKKLAEQGHKVAFVGDGINDSAALAYADVSVSFASGSDLARETADIVLTNDRVSDLLVAQDLARDTFSLVKQNIGIVGVPNLSALVIGTFLPVSPIAAVMLNNGSCLVAAANAMRVLGFRPRELPLAAVIEEPTRADAAVETLAVDPQPKAGGIGSLAADSAAVAVEPLSPPTVAVEAMAERVVSTSELAKRLGVPHQTLTARRNRADFRSWSEQRDPEGTAWLYCRQTKAYRLAA
jgi:hypothetical protein